jgi:hypothetical protein
MDAFEELAKTAGYTDLLVCVTKYRAGLNPRDHHVQHCSRPL